MAINGDYASKSDLNALRNDMNAGLNALRGNMNVLREDLNGLRGNMTAQRDELKEAIHDSETRLLKAFFDYAESNRLRLVSLETSTNSVTHRLDIVEKKVMDIEKRLSLPGQS